MAKFTSEYERAFKEAFEKLNPAQRKAVEHIEGPVLVIAGPGTGKTQILATRIGRILQHTDTPPHSILCLTYTDTGRAEMRNRLFKLIGPAAYRVHIHTFHSFCNEVIQDNLSYFGKQSLEAISELEEVELFKELLTNLPANSRLKSFKSDVNYEMPKVKNLYSLIKKEAWELDFLNKKIDQYISELPSKEGFYYKRNYKEFKAGDPNPDKIKDETEYMEKVREAVNLYPQYEKLMQEKARYTFDDMILWVLKAFDENNNILLNYQERFLYFLVDEFQDTSGSQKKLLKFLIDYWDTPNVFVVGDDDQSIFSFQDANVKNIIEFKEEYSAALHTVVLQENYRSTQPILDAAKVLIEHNEERLATIDTSLVKNLVSSKPSLKDLKSPPQIIEYPNSANEAICVAHKIEELIGNSVKPSEIAVIYRNHRQVEELSNYLEKRNILFNMKRNVNLLELPFVNNILTILQYIADEMDSPYSGDEALFEILHFDFFNIPPIDIARLSIMVAQRNYGGKKEKYSIRLAISEDGQNVKPDLFGGGEASRIKTVSNALESLIHASANLTLQGLFEEVIREAGILNYIVNSTEKPWLMQVVTGLFNFVKDETRKDPNLSLQRLLDIITSMDSKIDVAALRKVGTGISLTRLLDIITTMGNNRLRLKLDKITSSENAVNLVTAHGSKGTEYEHVFIIGCNKNIWDDKKSSSMFEYRLPDNLSSGEYKADELEEARRLFYVAMTRAKTHLFMSYPVQDTDNKNKTLERSAFVGEVIEGTGINEIKEAANEKVLLDFLHLQYIAKSLPEIELVDRNYINALLENYSLSVTHLNTYLDCPIRFYYQNLIKVPAAKGESMAFGSAVHSTLQALFEKMKGNSTIFPSKEEMLDDFSRFMYRNRESFTKDQYKRRIEYGNKILPPYYDFYINKWNKIVILEKNIRNVEVDGVPLNGKLDKLEFDGRKVNVVDYKTGNYENARKKLKAPDDNIPAGGDYWRQAVFYKILLDNQKYNDWTAISSEFDFVEPVKGVYKTEKIVITRQDIDIVLEQITDTWQHIQNHDFNKGCGKEDCHWCNFVKDNNLHVMLHEALEEE